MSPHSHRAPRFVIALAVMIAAALVLPPTALGQTTGATPAPAPSLTVSPKHGPPDPDGPFDVRTGLTVTGTGFKPNDQLTVTFNGTEIGNPLANDRGTWSLGFPIPNVKPGDYRITAKNKDGDRSASTSFTVDAGAANLEFSVTQVPPGTALVITGTNWAPGEKVTVTFNGPTIGTPTADTEGKFAINFTIPADLKPDPSYTATATGSTGTVKNVTFSVIPGNARPVPTAARTPAPVATPAPVPAPAPEPTAPAIVHDDRYFSQTGYRIANDQVWGFFQQYGGLSTFGYPVSRQMSFLGCPVQMFQRQIIQVCQGQGAALINMLDPEIFPYTQVNGSTFPAPDTTMKNNTPQVGSPTYAEDMNAFIAANVPDTALGQPVNFNLTFNTLGGLTIWGAPISAPQADPGNANFIYQRFQRGIMHYVVSQGTQSILLADYVKAILMNKDVPPDLVAQSRETRFFGQNSPGATLWLARPNDLPGTDLTYAFVNG